MNIPSNEAFARTIQRLIELATAAAQESERRHPSGEAFDFSEMVKSGFKESAESTSLRSFLSALSLLELLALQTVMYMGRDRDPERPEIPGVLADYHHFAQMPEPHQRALEKLMEKIPRLADYLRDGMKVAAAWGLTFDQLFKAALTPPSSPAQA